MSVEGWERSSLISLLKILKSGGTPNTSRSDFYGGEIPFVTIEDMSASRKYLRSTVKNLTKEGLSNSNTWVVPENSLLYSIYATLGLVRINKIPVTTNQAILAMIVDDEVVNQDYLYYWLEYIRDSVVNLSSQTTQSNLSATTVKPFVVQHPKDKKEQTQIAAILSTIDRVIEQTEAIIAKQQRIKTGLMQDLLTKGIDEDGNIRSEETHEFKDSAIGRIPAEWEVAAISKYGSKHKYFIRTGPFGSDLNTQHWVESGVPVLTIGSLGEGEIINHELLYVSDVTAKNLKGFCVEPGDIVFSRVADIGRSFVIESHQRDWIISSNLMRISLNLEIVEPAYLYRNIAFNAKIKDQLRITSNSGGRDLVNGQILANILFPWASFREQIRINKLLDRLDDNLSGLQKRLIKLNIQKTGLMQDLLTGKVRVTELLKDRETISP